MYQATTPTITMTFPSTSPDLTTLGTCVVTIQQGAYEFDITPTVNAHSLVFTLTQEQTLKLKPVCVAIQANFKNGSSRICSNVCTANVFENLKDEVI